MEFSNMASLCSGWKAGHAVTRAHLDKKYTKEGLGDYFDWWEANFYGPAENFDFGLGGGELQDYLTAEEIDYLVGLVRTPMPSTMNFFTLFTTIGHTYGELFPRIEQERPEVMEKLVQFRANMETVRHSTVAMGFANR